MLHIITISYKEWKKYVKWEKKVKLEKVAIIAMYLPLKAAQRDSISNLTSFGLQIWAAGEPNAVSFRVAVGAKLMPHSGCVMDRTGTKRNSEGV